MIEAFFTEAAKVLECHIFVSLNIIDQDYLCRFSEHIYYFMWKLQKWNPNEKRAAPYESALYLTLASRQQEGIWFLF